MAQNNAALKAKLEFIKTKFDFTTNVNILNSEDFKNLVNSNEMVILIITLINIMIGEHKDARLHEKVG